jgi:hypothetical protein
METAPWGKRLPWGDAGSFFRDVWEFIVGLVLNASVGQNGAANKKTDVAAVQGLLNRAAKAGLVVDGKCGPKTISAIKSFQAGFMSSPDGRVDVGGKTWQQLQSKAAGNSAPPIAEKTRDELLIEAIDAIEACEGAGIFLIDKTGNRKELRGGPRRKWCYVSLAPAMKSSGGSEQQLKTIYDRWQDVFFSCGSAAATGVVIWLSGGTATPVVGFFAVNSAALCGISVGKLASHDEWVKFEQQGGAEYKAWMTAETIMSLLDLFDGAAGAMMFLGKMKQAGKLVQLKKVLQGKKLKTRAEILAAIKQLDPSFNANLKSGGSGYVSKKQLLIAGEDALTAKKFKSVSNQQKQLVVGAVGNALTLADSGSTMDKVGDTYLLWLVQYDDGP